MERYYIKLKKGDTGTLLDVLSRYLKITEAEAGTLIHYGSIWNKDCKVRLKSPGFRVTGETLVVHKPKYKVNEYIFNETDIIYEDPWFYVLFKQPWFPTVPTPYADINSLSYGFGDFLKRTRRGEKAFVINRIDLATQGLVLFAKKKGVESKLHKLFQYRSIKKWYLVKTPVFDSPQRRYLIENTLEWQGKKKPAKTIVSLLGGEGSYLYFLAFPKTGRTHQIRKHFKTHIRPIYGDSTYGPYSKYDIMGLCCVCYIFPHPITGKKVVVKHVPEGFCR